MSTFRFSSRDFTILQGWSAPSMQDVSDAFLRAKGWALVRAEAFPDSQVLVERLRPLVLAAGMAAQVGLDLRGLRGDAAALLQAGRAAGASFVVCRHDAQLPDILPRVVDVANAAEAQQAAGQGAVALIGPARDLAQLQATGLPVMVQAHTPEEAEHARTLGAAGVQPVGPQVLDTPALADFRQDLKASMDAQAWRAFSQGPDALPRLRIRNLDLPYPIVQGGMGIGVSWEGLAGSVAAHGGVGLVSAIGTGYHPGQDVPRLHGRPRGTEALNPPRALASIIEEARRRSDGRGAVGVNILCAIEGYEAAVRASVEAGAQLVVSGAGLPMALPEMVGDADVALVPIVSSPRALSVICRQWSRKFNRLPDAVVLEGPLSGGHQGFTVEQCSDPAYSLEQVLPGVLAERDRWGDFPVLVAGGIWDHSDIRRFLALGASGVQMATRFIGTFECDAHPHFKEVLLKSRPEDIVLMPSPVGMPARGVRTALQASIERGTAPQVRCISHCLQPCGSGQSAKAAGYCIADRLADAQAGLEETGLFFSGANGHRLHELVSVRDLMEELTQDPGLRRLGMSLA